MAPQTRSSAPLLGTVLIVGGCGCTGYHLIRHLLQDPECGPIHVFDRNVENYNRHGGAGVSYTRGDITDAEALASLVEETKPTAIFHAASPMATLPSRREHEFADTNIKGTEILLTIAAEAPSVRAFVYTSTVEVYADPPYVDVDETRRLFRANDDADTYNWTKAVGDSLVRAANGPRLRTVCLRPGHMYGERQLQGLAEILDMCAGSRPLVQVGDGANLMEVVSPDNVVIPHILAAKALLDPSRARGRVDGEAFNISDGAPQPFWHHVRIIWKTARGEDALKNVVVVPAWIMIALVYLVEWLLRIFTLGIVKPPTALRRLSMEYCLYPHTYSIDKARQRLLFEPVTDHDAEVARAASWLLHHRRAVTEKQAESQS